jgi:hypothetical protein
LKLKKAGVNDFLWDTLCKFQNEKMFESYQLVGGTALSLQIEHHKLSVDDLKKTLDFEVNNYWKKILDNK